MKKEHSHVFTSESVSEGHPDKVADQISDAILDACLKADRGAHVACETMVGPDVVVNMGEITCRRFEKIDADAIGGTLPTALVATLWRRGLEPVFPGLGGLIDYSSYEDYMKDVFARHGRFAMFYVKPEYAHWIGIEKFKGRIRVMDPSNLGYTSFRQHEAIRSKKIAASCMIGFVRA